MNTYKFEEIPVEYQSDALENVSIYMYENHKETLFNNYDITFTQILEESKKLTFTYWGDILC